MSRVNFPQYLRSDDPEVVESIRQRDRIRDEWFAEVKAFAIKYGDGRGSYGINGGRLLFGGLAKPNADAGRWKQDGTPYKSNPLMAEFQDLTRSDGKVVGLPSMALIQGPNFGHYIVSYHCFVQDGIAWAGSTRSGSVRAPDAPDLTLWREVLGSEYMAAKEKYEAEAEAAELAHSGGAR